MLLAASCASKSPELLTVRLSVLSLSCITLFVLGKVTRSLRPCEVALDFSLTSPLLEHGDVLSPVATWHNVCDHVCPYIAPVKGHAGLGGEAL